MPGIIRAMKIETIEQVATIGNRTSLVGGTAGAVGAFLASNVVGLLGVLVALLGVLVNVHFKREARRIRQELADLEKEEIRARIRLMNATGVPVIPVPPDMANKISTDFGALETEGTK